MQRRALRRAEGELTRSEALADPTLAARPLAEQLAFWTDFRQRYPDVPVDEQYRAVLTARQNELEEERLQRRIEELERRVARAEQEAARAAEKAERARASGTYFSYYRPPVVYYPRVVSAAPVATRRPAACARPHSALKHADLRGPGVWQHDFLSPGISRSVSHGAPLSTTRRSYLGLRFNTRIH
jgi:hypothetical protein